MNFDYEEERDLTACETLIMKCIWDFKKDPSTKELQAVLLERFGKDYAVTTLRTFLINLSDKGFIKSYRVKRSAYVHPLKSQESYRLSQLRKQRDFWYDGKLPDLVYAVLQSADEISKEDRLKIRGILAERGIWADRVW